MSADPAGVGGGRDDEAMQKLGAVPHTHERTEREGTKVQSEATPWQHVLGEGGGWNAPPRTGGTAATGTSAPTARETPS